MDGIIDFVVKLLPIIIAVLYFLGSVKGRGKVEEAEDDPEAAERARKIQEEIRRKILERQQKSQPSSRPASQPESPTLRETQPAPELRPAEPKSARQTVPSPRPPVRLESVESTSSAADIYEQQRRKIEAELEKSRELRRQAGTPASTKASNSPVFYGDLTASFNSRLREDLRDPNSIRKAILLKEILDTPVGLRQSS